MLLIAFLVFWFFCICMYLYSVRPEGGILSWSNQVLANAACIAAADLLKSSGDPAILVGGSPNGARRLGAR